MKTLWRRAGRSMRKEKGVKDRTAGLAKCFLSMLVIALVIPLAAAAYAENEGWLGVMLQPLTDDIIAAMGLEKGAAGVLVSDVVDESPADQVDIEKGDIIIEIDGTAITGVEQAVEQVKSHAVGDQVKVVVLRDGKKQVFTVTLGERGKMEKGMQSMESKEGPGGIRMPRVERWIEDFKDFDVSKGGHIGVRIQDITADLSPYFGVGKDGGVLILDVIEGSPAAEAGLRGGDVVLKVDGKPVCCSGPFAELIRQHEPGDKVEITFKRQGEIRRMDVEVGKGPKLFEKFLGEAGAPGVYLWEENVPGGHKRMTVRVGDEGCGPTGGHKCIVLGDDCCKGMMGKGMGESMKKCMVMGEKCKGMMGMDMDECKQKCKMMGMDMDECMKKCMVMKEKHEGMMGEGSEASMPEGMSIRKKVIKSGDDDPVKCFMMESEKGDLKQEVEALRLQIEDLKKEIQGLKK